MGALHVDLHQWLRPERANDDVARNALHRVWIDALSAGVLPNQTVIEAELLNVRIADAVSSAIADMSDPGAVGPQEQSRRRGAHALKFAILLAAGMDAGVGFDKGFAECVGRAVVSVLDVSMRNNADGEFAGQ